MLTFRQTALVFSALAMLCACRDRPAPTAAPVVVDASPGVEAAPPKAIDLDAHGDVSLALSHVAKSQREVGVKVTLSPDVMRMDGERVPLDGFNHPDKMVRLAMLNADQKALADLQYQPLTDAAKEHFARASTTEVTVYADSSLPYLALGTALSSLQVAGMTTLHLAVKAPDGSTRTYDMKTRDKLPDADATAMHVFATFVRVQSKARTCEAKPMRDPWDMPELAACAASVKKAAPKNDGVDEIVIVPGMAEMLSALVTMLDAVAPSFPAMSIVVDGDILRADYAKEELARIERAKKLGAGR